ncbi:universal stress protein [Acidiferrimicrobium sp. IK]|uniref:universal stress protein n=1 Tax=Acidiferrimicrobium sp. IK TaxID=2871700 RepID=UPI0021CB2DFB|nr:universal stress protein [Acidiferrimicrobium sp. IK]MCU4186399.1 universal stress protein [Acidiferrimicrobium sp. IK]
MSTIQHPTGSETSAAVKDRALTALSVAAYHQVARSAASFSAANKTAVVGLDGSPGSQAALRWAAEWATQPGTQIVAVHAVRPSAALVRDIPPMGLVPWRYNLRRHVAADWCRPLAGSGAPYRVLVADDTAADALVRVADHHDADLIVIGAPSAGLSQRLVGSVADRVVRHAHRPVMIVPAERR